MQNSLAGHCQSLAQVQRPVGASHAPEAHWVTLVMRHSPVTVLQRLEPHCALALHMHLPVVVLQVSPLGQALPPPLVQTAGCVPVGRGLALGHTSLLTLGSAAVSMVA